MHAATTAGVSQDETGSNRLYRRLLVVRFPDDAVGAGNGVHAGRRLETPPCCHQILDMEQKRQLQ